MSDPAQGDELGAYPLDHSAGYFTAPRDVASVEALMREPSGLMLRLWVLLHTRVRHAPAWVRAANGLVELERGQCVIGIRELAGHLGVGKDAVQRGLRDLERIGLIARRAGHAGSVVSVRNYGLYGNSEAPAADTDPTQARHGPDTDPDTGPTQTRHAPGHRPDTDPDLTNGRTGNGERIGTGERARAHGTDGTGARGQRRDPRVGAVEPDTEFAGGEVQL